METQLIETLWDEGLAVVMLVILLLWLYKMMKPFLNSYLALVKERDTAFINKLWDIISHLKSSKDEHQITRQLIKEKHKDLLLNCKK